MAIEILGYELKCTDCGAELGKHHEFMSMTTENGTVVQSFFGVIHRCEGITDEEYEAVLAEMHWGPWSPDRRRQKALSASA